MFAEVRVNRPCVTQLLMDRGLFVARPSASTSHVRRMAACLEAAEGCIIATFARLLCQRHHQYIEGYIHDAILIPNCISLSNILSVFHEASRLIVGTALELAVVDWGPLVQEALQLCPLGLTRGLSLVTLTSEVDETPRLPVRRVRRNTGKRRRPQPARPR